MRKVSDIPDMMKTGSEWEVTDGKGVMSLWRVAKKQTKGAYMEGPLEAPRPQWTMEFMAWPLKRETTFHDGSFTVFKPGKYKRTFKQREV